MSHLATGDKENSVAVLFEFHQLLSENRIQLSSIRFHSIAPSDSGISAIFAVIKAWAEPRPALLGTPYVYLNLLSKRLPFL